MQWVQKQSARSRSHPPLRLRLHPPPLPPPAPLPLLPAKSLRLKKMWSRRCVRFTHTHTYIYTEGPARCDLTFLSHRLWPKPSPNAMCPALSQRSPTLHPPPAPVCFVLYPFTVDCLPLGSLLFVYFQKKAFPCRLLVQVIARRHHRPLQTALHPKRSRCLLLRSGMLHCVTFIRAAPLF